MKELKEFETLKNTVIDLSIKFKKSGNNKHFDILAKIYGIIYDEIEEIKKEKNEAI